VRHIRGVRPHKGEEERVVGQVEEVARIQAVRPGAGLTFMIALGADAVAAELAGRHPNGA
jgi:hypothetical protein